MQFDARPTLSPARIPDTIGEVLSHPGSGLQLSRANYDIPNIGTVAVRRNEQGGVDIELPGDSANKLTFRFDARAGYVGGTSIAHGFSSEFGVDAHQDQAATLIAGLTPANFSNGAY